MKYNETYEKIEAYLRGELPEGDRILFEQEILADSRLAEQVHLQESDHLVMEVLVENDLRKRLKQWQGEKETKKEERGEERKSPFCMNWVGGLLGLLVLCGLCYYYMDSINDRNGQQASIMSAPEENLPQTPSASEDTKTTTSIEDKIDVQEEEKKDLKVASKSDGDSKKEPKPNSNSNNNTPQKPVATATTVPPTPMEHIVSYHNSGNYYYGKGDYERAIVYHEKALNIQLGILGEKHPDLAKAYKNLRDAYKKKGDVKKTNEYHMKFLEVQPDSLRQSKPTNPVTTIIDDYDDTSRYDELWETRSIEKPENSLDTALLDLKNKNYDLAAQKLALNYAQNSDNMSAAYYLGMAYYEQRNLGQAISLLQKVVAKESFGSRRQAEWILAMAYLRDGQLEDGKASLEKIRKDEWGEFAGDADALFKALE